MWRVYKCFRAYIGLEASRSDGLLGLNSMSRCKGGMIVNPHADKSKDPRH